MKITIEALKDLKNEIFIKNISDDDRDDIIKKINQEINKIVSGFEKKECKEIDIDE